MPDTITTRRMRFDFPEHMQLVFIPGDPPMSASFLGSWMTLPYLEPYLIRSMKAAAERIHDPRLLADIRGFTAQEAVHFKEHARANRVIRSVHPSCAERLADLEEQLKADYERFSSTKSLAWNLAYAEAFEAITAASARTQFEMRMFDDMVAPLGDLFAWHVMEELEHRTVAFEVLQAIRPGWLFRVVVGVRCLAHYFSWTSKMTKALSEAVSDPANINITKQARRRRMAFVVKTAPRWLNVFRPGYHPRKAGLPRSFYEVQARYDARAAA